MDIKLQKEAVVSVPLLKANCFGDTNSFASLVHLTGTASAHGLVKYPLTMTTMAPV
jgi:hypothetical protein